MKISLISNLAKALYDKKGENILALDVRGVSTMTDYFLIAEGTSPPHLKALKKTLLQALDKEGVEVSRVEGEQAHDWVVIDCLNLVIHLFTAPLRQKYGIERVWCEGKILNLIFEK